jgi:dTDP-4-dehydrorhamnose 3,5-epimerase
MMFTELEVKGAFVIEPDKKEDARGYFARTWCRKEFLAHGLNPSLVQCNISYSKKKGTLRGLHLQAPPHEEAKLVRCTRGAIYDVILDLRRDSPTFRRWIALELTAENNRVVYVPEGFAHGFQSLEDATEVFYQTSDFYCPKAEWGVRWNDPTFGVEWPLGVSVISEKDASLEDFRKGY